MRTVFFATLSALICSMVLLMLVSCKAQTESAESTDVQNATESVQITTTCHAQQILDGIYDNVELKDGRIYLSFGTRTTLTVDNFNRLILEDQLGLAKGRFTFVIDSTILSALRHNNAYGGIGFDQEWITTLNVCIKDNVTGEISAPAELIMTLCKSEDADNLLNENDTETFNIPSITEN